MSGAERRAWEQEYDERKAAGDPVKRVGGMEMVQDRTGAWFQRNGDACPGKGYDQQAINDSPCCRQPPATRSNPRGRATRTLRPWERL
jgi:hypothetical protein